ncbi:DUF1516 family protein [Lentilactobacillus laojiaonis]|uniref:DUF1516 family protein n=1 Tax=Lentilactobacillus laojiaonis TaxID=2883998 RepID=UPI001D0A0BE7|nr:YisL family protein [Lentilactobacillus laojiaonis]
MWIIFNYFSWALLCISYIFSLTQSVSKYITRSIIMCRLAFGLIIISQTVISFRTFNHHLIAIIIGWACSLILIYLIESSFLKRQYLRFNVWRLFITIILIIVNLIIQTKIDL